MSSCVWVLYSFIVEMELSDLKIIKENQKRKERKGKLIRLQRFCEMSSIIVCADPNFSILYRWSFTPPTPIKRMENSNKLKIQKKFNINTNWKEIEKNEKVSTERRKRNKNEGRLYRTTAAMFKFRQDKLFRSKNVSLFISLLFCCVRTMCGRSEFEPRLTARRWFHRFAFVLIDATF